MFAKSFCGGLGAQSNKSGVKSLNDTTWFTLDVVSINMRGLAQA